MVFRLVAHSFLVVLGLLLGLCKCQNLTSFSVVGNDTDVGTTGRILQDADPGDTPTTRYGPDHIKLGKYTLLGCSSEPRGANADYLSIMLPTMFNHLSSVIEETQEGTSGLHGYGAFFKSEENKLAVERVIRGIKEGAQVRLRNSEGIVKFEAPKIICLGEHDDSSRILGIENLYNYYCNNGYEDFSPATQYKSTELVMLCPDFFRLPPWPVIQECPRVFQGALHPDGTELMDSQFSILIRALAGIYIPMTGHRPTAARPNTPPTLRSVVGSPGGVGIRDRNNYAYYASCKLIFMESICYFGHPVDKR